MVLGQFLRVQQRFENFHDRLDKVWGYRFNSLMNSSIDLKFGGMMHSTCTMKQIAVEMAQLGQFCVFHGTLKFSMIGLDQVWGTTLSF